jgi:hypothetical protein
MKDSIFIERKTMVELYKMELTYILINLFNLLKKYDNIKVI